MIWSSQKPDFNIKDCSWDYMKKELGVYWRFWFALQDISQPLIAEFLQKLCANVTRSDAVPTPNNDFTPVPSLCIWIFDRASLLKLFGPLSLFLCRTLHEIIRFPYICPEGYFAKFHVTTIQLFTVLRRNTGDKYWGRCCLCGILYNLWEWWKCIIL